MYVCQSFISCETFDPLQNSKFRFYFSVVSIKFDSLKSNIYFFPINPIEFIKFFNSQPWQNSSNSSLFKNQHLCVDVLVVVWSLCCYTTKIYNALKKYPCNDNSFVIYVCSCQFVALVSFGSIIYLFLPRTYHIIFIDINYSNMKQT